jgi:hypothetical protein
MESLLLSPRFAPTPTSSPLFSRSRLRPSLQLPPRLRHRHVRLRSTPGGSDAAEDEARATIKDDDLWTVARKVLDAYRSSDNDLRTFLQNLVDAGLADESEVFGSGGKDDDELLRAFLDADVSPDLGALWKLPALAAFSFAGVPALLGYFGDAAGVERVPAWMPLVYSLSSFLLGSLLVADASVGDEEWEELGDRGGGDLAFLESEEVLQRMTWRSRLPRRAWRRYAWPERSPECTTCSRRSGWLSCCSASCLVCRTGCSRPASTRRCRVPGSAGTSSSATSATWRSAPTTMTAAASRYNLRQTLWFFPPYSDELVVVFSVACKKDVYMSILVSTFQLRFTVSVSSSLVPN